MERYVDTGGGPCSRREDGVGGEEEKNSIAEDICFNWDSHMLSAARSLGKPLAGFHYIVQSDDDNRGPLYTSAFSLVKITLTKPNPLQN